MEQNKDTAKLLDLYFEGRTTREQEQLLREYLSQDSEHPDHLYARIMFDMFRKASCTAAPDVPSVAQRTGRAVQVQGKRTFKRQRTVGGIKRLGAAFAGAACVALAVYLIFGKGPTEKVYCYVNGNPVTDPAIAVQQVENAGILLREGLETTFNGLKGIDKARRSLASLGMAVELLDKNLPIPDRSLNALSDDPPAQGRLPL